MRPGRLPAGATGLVLVCALAGVAAAVSARTAAASSRSASAATTVYPDDPNIRHTEYVRAAVTHTVVVFDRPGVANGNAIASPGTRINFRTDATRVSIMVTYTFACGAAGCGRFSVEQDGRPLVPSFGSDVASGPATYVIATQALPGLRSYSVIWPYGTQVVLNRLQLEGGQHRLYAPPPTRPTRRYVAYGDSITQGYFASGIVHTYPTRSPGRSTGASSTWASAARPPCPRTAPPSGS
jgi:hypothetical protein